MLLPCSSGRAWWSQAQIVQTTKSPTQWPGFVVLSAKLNGQDPFLLEIFLCGFVRDVTATR